MVTKNSTASKAPWTQENPKKRTGESAHHLSPTEKTSAKAAAKKAGRPYPNLVDNMQAAAKGKRKTK